MSDNLTVKLGADTSEFRGQLAGAVQSSTQAFGQMGHAGENAASRFGTAFEHKLFGMRHLSGAVATAIGLNFEHIGEEVARFILGFSKAEEESLKKVQELGKQTAEIYDKIFEARRTDVQNLTNLEADQARLERETAETNQAITERGSLSLSKRIALLTTTVGLFAVLKNYLNEQKTAEDKSDNAERAKKLAEDQAKKEELQRKIKSDDAKRVKEDMDDVVEGLKKEREEKDKAAKHEKENQDAARQFQEHLNSLKEREHKLALDVLPPAERLKKLTEERQAIDQRIQDGYHDEESNLQDKIALHEHDLEIVRLTAEVQEEARKKEKQAAGDIGVLQQVSGFARYFKPTDQAAYEKQLVESAGRDTDFSIKHLQEMLTQMMQGGSSEGKFEAPALNQRLKGLQSRKAHLQDYVFNPNYSDAAGAGIFAQQVRVTGDPLGLQKKNTDQLGEISTKLGNIDTRLHMAGFARTGYAPPAKGGEF